MRRIETQNIKEKKQNRTKVLVGFILIFLMITSTIGFALFYSSGTETTDSIEYKGIEFFTNGVYWQSEIDGNIIITSYQPEETEGILDLEVSKEDFSDKILYYVSGDEEAAAMQEIVQNVGRYSTRYQEACLDMDNCRNEDLVVKTCSDSVISLSIGEEIKAYKEENCIFLEAPSNQLRLLSDAFVFKILEIQ